MRLDEVRVLANYEYPTDLLDDLDAETGLLLFGAGFYGRNDGIHLADAGLTCTVIDVDLDKMAAMKRVYPSSWTFEVCDVFDWIRRPVLPTFDVVSVDPQLAHMGISMDWRRLWAARARKLLVIGARTWRDGTPEIGGWEVGPEYRRNDTAKWCTWLRV